MRCKNCGWVNSTQTTECEKCHSPLEADLLKNDTKPISDKLKGTISESRVFAEQDKKNNPLKGCPICGYPTNDASLNCPNCNYQFPINDNQKQSKVCNSCGSAIELNAKFCSSCGTPQDESSTHVSKKIQRSGLGTVIGGPISGLSSSNKFCTLKPIAWEGEDVNYNPITFSGETIILNRANTDANNNSITSQEQAILSFEDGNWYIENKSILRTTYIRVNNKIKLSSGEIIILGNREFEFKG